MLVVGDDGEAKSELLAGFLGYTRCVGGDSDDARSRLFKLPTGPFQLNELVSANSSAKSPVKDEDEGMIFVRATELKWLPF